MVNAFEHLAHLSVDEFLQDYWQQKPVFLPQLFQDLEGLISGDDLAALSLENQLPSRLILEHPATHSHTAKKFCGRWQKEGRDHALLHSDWQVEHGPLHESRFPSLPDTHWTLLVQSVDLVDPDLLELKEYFRFLPQWRCEDIMVSFATPGGGVGPHFDYYDVFLIQGEGERRWRIGQSCNADSPLVPGLEQKILRDFHQTDEYITRPGDVLYIPPGIAHWGVATSNSVTYSLGFRAPSVGDIALEVAQEFASKQSADCRFRDTFLRKRSLSGEIDSAAIASIQEILSSMSENSEMIKEWFGAFMTRPLYSEENDYSVDPQTAHEQLTAVELPTEQERGLTLTKTVRCAFMREASSDEALSFVNGHKYKTSVFLAEQLSEYKQIFWHDLDMRDQTVIRELLHCGLME